MVAAWELTAVRSLVGMNSKVVEKVVPFSEYFGASLMSAKEHPYDSSGVWALILEDHEVFSVWDMFFYSDLSQVKVSTTLYRN